MSYNMTNVLGILFANAHDEAIPELTSNRAMGSVPFGGRFRLIDFQLSGMVNSGMSTVAVITKENYQSLLDHIGSGRNWDLARSDGGLTILPPYGNVDAGRYTGKIDALYKAIGYIKKVDCEYVIISDCNVVTSADYSKLIEAHIKCNADITVLANTAEFTAQETEVSVTYGADESGRVKEVVINRAKAGLCSMGLNCYVLKKQLLIDLVSDLVPRGRYSWGKDVLQAKINELNIHMYEYTKCYSRITDLESYYKASMELFDPEKLSKLILKKRPVYTKIRDDAPAKYGLDSSVTNSMVADGCVIDGIVENSILFRGVKVGKGAVIKNCILMQDTVVGKNTHVSNIITDKQVSIGDDLSISSSGNYPLYIAKNRKL